MNCLRPGQCPAGSFSCGSLGRVPASSFQPKIDAELRAAAEARRTGNEAKARVRARRAAGWAAEEFLRGVGHEPRRGAVECLRQLAQRAEVPLDVRQAASRLTVHVTPEHVLPHSQDPLEDARRVIEGLRKTVVHQRPPWEQG